MATRAETENAKYVCDAKDDEDDNVWIYFEPSGSGLQVLGNGFLCLRFRRGTPLEQVGQIAEFLNRNMESVSYTRFLE